MNEYSKEVQLKMTSPVRINDTSDAFSGLRIHTDDSPQEVSTLDQRRVALAKLRNDTVSGNTRDQYVNKMTKFLIWMFAEYRNICTDAFLLKTVDNYLIEKEKVKMYLLDCAQTHPPLHFDLVTPEMFLMYVVVLREKKPDLSYSSLNNERAAFRFLFTMYRTTLSVEFSQELKVNFKGIKRSIAVKVQGGEGNILPGKVPLDFSMYKWISRQYLSKEGKEFLSHVLGSILESHVQS